MRRNLWLIAILVVLLLSAGSPQLALAQNTPSPASLPADCLPVGKFFGDVGYYAKNLKTGQVLMYRPDNIFAAASTIKVPVSIVVYRHFYKQADPALRNVYDTGVELMMTSSENDYFAEFLDEIEDSIGPAVIREHFSRLGMQHTTIRDAQAREAFGYSNVTTARDMALIFEQLYRGNLLGPEKTKLMLDAMANSIFPDEMARHLQSRKVIHKIGELDDVLADVGVVEGPGGPILISIFTETPQEGDYASDFIAALSACLYSRLSGEPITFTWPAN